METWRSIVALLQQGDYLASGSLHRGISTYSHPEQTQKVPQFYYGNNHFQYQAMPFGLTAAPGVFTNLLVTLVARLRCQGVALYPYLDNILIRSPSRERALLDIQLTLSCLCSMGFLVNQDKSCLSPTQRLVHLRILLNTQQFTVSLSQDWHSSLLRALKEVRWGPLSRMSCSWQDFWGRWYHVRTLCFGHGSIFDLCSIFSALTYPG